MTKCKVWIGVALLFAASTAVLLHGTLDRSISHTHCFDELESSKMRERLLKEVLRPLQPQLTKSQLEAAIQRSGLGEQAFDKGKHERVVASTVFVFDEAGVLREIQFE